MILSQPAPVDRRTVLAGAAAGIGVGMGGNSGVGPAASARAQGASGAPPRRVLWAANLRTKSFDDRLRAAEAGGFAHMSVFPINWRAWTDAGLTGPEMRRRMRAAGVEVTAIDPFVQWVPGFVMPPGYPEAYTGFIDFDVDAILRIADDLGASAINCVEGLAQPHETSALIEALGAFSDRASAAGLQLTFEFMPISSVPDLAAGWALVSGVDRSNLGLRFDPGTIIAPRRTRPCWRQSRATRSSRCSLRTRSTRSRRRH